MTTQFDGVMKLLLVESTPGIATNIRAELERADHLVATCYDADGDSPCIGVAHPARCPFVRGHVDLALVVRRAGEPDSLLEMGAVCAQRHRRPVVHLDPTIPSADVTRVVRHSAAAGNDRMEAAYSAAVRWALDSPTTLVESSRGQDSVRVALTVDTADATQRARLADVARAAVREYDPFVRVIDVAVR